MSSIRNTVVVAIMQVGVLVAGVLAAGVCHKGFVVRGLAVPMPAMVLGNYGVAGLVIPLVWGVTAVAVQLRAGVSEDVKTLVGWLGLLLLIALAVFVLYADVTPWFGVMEHMGGEEE